MEMKKLGYVLVVIGIIASLDGCHIGGRHTVIVENGNGKERRIEYRGYAYFTPDSSAISRISPNGTVNMCAGQTTVLTANSGNNLAYQWQKGVAAISGATNITYNATLAGKYKVTVTNAKVAL